MGDVLDISAIFPDGIVREDGLECIGVIKRRIHRDVVDEMLRRKESEGYVRVSQESYRGRDGRVGGILVRMRHGDMLVVVDVSRNSWVEIRSYRVR